MIVREVRPTGVPAEETLLLRAGSIEALVVSGGVVALDMPISATTLIAVYRVGDPTSDLTLPGASTFAPATRRLTGLDPALPEGAAVAVVLDGPGGSKKLADQPDAWELTDAVPAPARGRQPVCYWLAAVRRVRHGPAPDAVLEVASAPRGPLKVTAHGRDDGMIDQVRAYLQTQCRSSSDFAVCCQWPRRPECRSPRSAPMPSGVWPRPLHPAGGSPAPAHSPRRRWCSANFDTSRPRPAHWRGSCSTDANYFRLMASDLSAAAPPWLPPINYLVYEGVDPGSVETALAGYLDSLHPEVLDGLRREIRDAPGALSLPLADGAQIAGYFTGRTTVAGTRLEFGVIVPPGQPLGTAQDELTVSAKAALDNQILINSPTSLTRWPPRTCSTAAAQTTPLSRR